MPAWQRNMLVDSERTGRESAESGQTSFAGPRGGPRCWGVVRVRKAVCVLQLTAKPTRDGFAC